MSFAKSLLKAAFQKKQERRKFEEEVVLVIFFSIFSFITINLGKKLKFKIMKSV